MPRQETGNEEEKRHRDPQQQMTVEALIPKPAIEYLAASGGALSRLREDP